MSDRFIISRQYITLVVGFLFIAIFTLTLTQTYGSGVELSIYEIAVRQLLFGLVGVMILFMSVMGGQAVLDWKNRLEPSPFDFDRGWLVWGLIGTISARIVGSLVSAIQLSAITFINSTIALTSAVFEEPLFCGLGLLFYSILDKFTRHNVMISVIGSTSIVAFMFAIIHIGVYGLSIPIMLFLAVGRVAFNLVFLKTRTMMAPTVAHILFNSMVLLGV